MASVQRLSLITVQFSTNTELTNCRTQIYHIQNDLKQQFVIFCEVMCLYYYEHFEQCSKSEKFVRLKPVRVKKEEGQYD